MIRSKIRASLLIAAAVAATTMVLGAQVNTGKPIRLKAPQRKVVKFRGEVLHANSAQITVAKRDDARFIRTFSYSPEAREKMLKIIDQGGYQYGDKVEIRHVAGTDVALKIKGKPSKPL